MTPRITFISTLLGILLAGRVEAQSGGVYSISWSNLGGGGQTASTGGVYQLGGTAGQPDAAPLAGGVYSLKGGFWVPGVQPRTEVEAPVLEPVPLAFTARAPEPNPFRSTTTLAFELPAARTVRLVVHGVDGRVVRRLAEGPFDAGRHRAIWDGRDDGGHAVASGIYFARLVAGEFNSTLRIVRIN